MRAAISKLGSGFRTIVFLGLGLLTVAMAGGTVWAAERSSIKAVSCMGACDPRTGSGCHGECGCIAVSSTRGRCIPF